MRGWLANCRYLSIGIAEVERQLQQALKLPLPMKIAFACSLGYPAGPTTPFLRVRRELEAFVHHNLFGHKDGLWRRTRNLSQFRLHEHCFGVRRSAPRLCWLNIV
jgi:hypothetical protein